MAKCPRDGTPIDIDYGMTACPTCGVILFIDMEGEAQLGSNASDVPFAVGELNEDTKLGVSTPLELSFDEVPSEEPPPPPASEPFGDPLAALHLDQPDDLTSPIADLTDPGVDPVEGLAMDQFLGYAEPPAPSAVEDAGTPGDPLGIVEYANSEYSQAKDGPLLFRLIISGIDSKEIRESLREAITDSRFGWDVDAIMREISRGELQIQNVSPVKATIVINRIKRLPVRIRWEQYAITQSEPS